MPSDRPLVSAITYGATSASPVVVELLGATAEERRAEAQARRARGPFDPPAPPPPLPAPLAAIQRPLFGGAPKRTR